MKAIIIPGNGCDTSLDDCMWYPWMAAQLRKLNIAVNLTAFPDPIYARESIWVPYAVETLGLDADTIVIGHSSGAACALRLMEQYQMKGCVLVSAYHNDMGDELERGSGYFSRDFDWAAMKANAPWCVQFHSKNDHLVPVAVGREVAKLLGSEYEERPSDGHFQDDTYPCILEAIKRHL